MCKRHNPGNVEQVQKRPVLRFHESLSAYLYIISQGYIDGPVFWELSSITQKGCHESPRPISYRDCSCPFLSSTYVQGSTFLGKGQKSWPTMPKHWPQWEWNKSRRTSHYRIWIPAVCSQLCLAIGKPFSPSTSTSWFVQIWLEVRLFYGSF